MTHLDTIDHVAIRVENVAQAIEWYKANTQCKVVYQDETWGLIKYANLYLALVMPDSHPPHIAIPCNHPEAYGTPQQHRDGTRSVYIQDPFGNNIEMIDGLHHHNLENIDE